MCRRQQHQHHLVMQSLLASSSIIAAICVLALANNFLRIKFVNAAAANNKCEDGMQNLAEASSNPSTISEYPVVMKILRGKVYHPSSRPACHNGRATVLMPGIVKLFDGEMYVPQNNYDLIQSGTIRMTIESPSFDKPICINGTSKYAFFPNSLCSFNLCEFIGHELCTHLQTPGRHTIRSLEEKINFNSTLLLPEPPSILGISILDILSGEFSFVMTLETGGKDIVEVRIPTNQQFLQIGLDSTDPECE